MLSELFKICPPMTPLQERVSDLGVCLKCHTKTLVLRHLCEHMQTWQCEKCKTVVILPPESETD